jgi:hypothetical protein
MRMFKKQTTIFHEPRTKEIVRLRLLEKSEKMTDLVDNAIETDSLEKPAMFGLGTKTDIDLHNFVKKFQIDLSTLYLDDDFE